MCHPRVTMLLGRCYKLAPHPRASDLLVPRTGGSMKQLAFLIALVIAVPQSAGAQAPPPQCSTLSNPVYLQVGDTQLNLMKRLGRALRDNKLPNGDPNPITLVFITSGSCPNIQAIYKRIAIPATTNMQYIPSRAEVADADWTTATPTLSCTPEGGVVPDI